MAAVAAAAAAMVAAVVAVAVTAAAIADPANPNLYSVEKAAAFIGRALFVNSFS